jgi:16S rRNA (cytosine1402-N4)-methyltransferase
MRTRRSQSSSNPVSSQHAEAHHAQATLIHRPVLLHEVIEGLAIEPSDTVVDTTLGGAGHAREIAARLGPKGTLIGFDLDAEAIARAKDALKDASCTVHLVEANFRHIGKELGLLGITSVSKVLFDLGWSAYQLDAGRGFSFLRDEPLEMTYGISSLEEKKILTASTIVNEWAEESLADIIYGWGEERYSRRIARAIVAYREKKKIDTSRELAEVIKGAVAVGYRHGRIHPATRTFQALRIAVNDELGALKEGLEGAWRMLKSTGRIAVISFHSIEDRLVKQKFMEWEKAGEGLRITKKPLVAGREELEENPRARSAKVRIIQKI